jgi:hypothetical protein
MLGVLVGLALWCVSSAKVTVGYSVHQLDAENAPWLFSATHANAGRFFLCWKYLQGGGKPSAINMSLTLEQAMREGDALTAEFLANPDFQGGIRATTKALSAVSARGMALFLSVGDGGANCLPNVVPASSPSSPAIPMDPNYVGIETYLAHTYILSRALVRQFGGNASAIQLGNELNYCWVAALGGEFHWRNATARATSRGLLHQAIQGMRAADPTSWLFDLIGQWGNASFITQVVWTVRAAVKAERRECLAHADRWGARPSDSQLICQRRSTTWWTSLPRSRACSRCPTGRT